MNLTEVIAELRELNEPVPKPFRLPTESEVSAAEKRLNMRFHDDYRRFLLEASDVVVGSLEPAMVAADCGYLNLCEIAEYAWDEMELPLTLLPICEDNGDYYCMNKKGEVEFWTPDGEATEKWNNLAVWIKEVWIDGE
jgi:hypothetical protein